MGYLPDSTVAAFRGFYNLGLFFRLDTDPPLHLWWGVSDVYASIPDLDVGGELYLGGGLLADMPDAVEILMNGAAERVDWSLNGIPPGLTAHLHENAPSVVGARADFAVAPLDSNWQLRAPPISIWVGTADLWAEAQPMQADVTKPKFRTLTLSTMSGDSTRALPYYSTWTDRDQKNLSPTDTFCERVPRYYPGQIIRWPRF